MIKYLLAGLFASLGVGLGAVNVWNNALAINDGHLVLNDLTAIVASLAITAALASLTLAFVVRRSWAYGLMALMVIWGATYTSVGYTLQRIGETADHRFEAARKHNGSIDQAKAEIDRLKGELSKQQQIAALECRGYKPGVSQPKRWPRCLTARGLIGDHQEAIAAELAILANLGPRKPADPAGERLEAATAGVITSDRYRTSHPLVTAVTLEMGVNLLFGIAGLIAAGRRKARRAVHTIEAQVITPADRAYKALESAGSMSNGDLAKALGWHPTKVSRTVKALRAEGRVMCQRDGQRVLLTAV